MLLDPASGRAEVLGSGFLYPEHAAALYDLEQCRRYGPHLTCSLLADVDVLRALLAQHYAWAAPEGPQHAPPPPPVLPAPPHAAASTEASQTRLLPQ